MFLLNCFKNTLLLFVFMAISCGKSSHTDLNTSQKEPEITQKKDTSNDIVIGANRINTYLPLLKGKSIGIVANQTSLLQIIERKAINPNTMGSEKVEKHLVDFLHEYNSIDVKKVLALEHGFRGKADAGEIVKNGKDTKTNLPIISLYGKNKKPTSERLNDLDVVIFDIQDVGARFYTYISSLHYIMEACAENNVKLIVLDRPNPNGHIIDGPILEPQHQSFIGMHEIPVLHGMTIGEYAQMINGEKWLKNKVNCDLTVIPMENYNHNMFYDLPIKPSPNLPNETAINLYPSLCFFEGTNVSVGRGTNKQFQIYGAPFFPKMDFSFTPQPNEGAKYPKHENKLCYGYNLSEREPLNKLDINFVVNAYKLTADKSSFFLENNFFTKLAGTEKLRQQIEKGLSPSEIYASWKDGLEKFKKIRAKYLLYK